MLRFLRFAGEPGQVPPPVAACKLRWHRPRRFAGSLHGRILGDRCIGPPTCPRVAIQNRSAAAARWAWPVVLAAAGVREVAQPVYPIFGSPGVGMWPVGYGSIHVVWPRQHPRYRGRVSGGSENPGPALQVGRGYFFVLFTILPSASNRIARLDLPRSDLCEITILRTSSSRATFPRRVGQPFENGYPHPGAYR